MQLPKFFTDEYHLEDVMSTPSQALLTDMQHLEGDIMELGAAGKMGPTLARMAKRAAPDKRIVAVARFTDTSALEKLKAQGVECIQADLLNQDALNALPDVSNIIYMAGRKFGSQGSEWLTWAMNAYLPAMVAQRFQQSKISVFSTACVYPFVPIDGHGALEAVSPTPVGEYANSCVARERMFEHFSHALDTPGCLLRLSYAIDMRYGVLHDLAQSLIQQQDISLAMGHANIIWQGDANEIAIRSLLHCRHPTQAINLSGPIVSIRAAAIGLAQRLGVTAKFIGTEAPTAWLVDCNKMNSLFGAPQVSLNTMLDWTAAWAQQGKASLGKPTHFEVRDGNY